MSNNPFINDPNHQPWMAGAAYPDIQQAEYTYPDINEPAYQQQHTGAAYPTQQQQGAFVPQPSGMFSPTGIQQQASYGMDQQGQNYAFGGMGMQQPQPQQSYATTAYPYTLQPHNVAPSYPSNPGPSSYPSNLGPSASRAPFVSSLANWNGNASQNSGFHNPSNPVSAFDPLAQQPQQPQQQQQRPQPQQQRQQQSYQAPQPQQQQFQPAPPAAKPAAAQVVMSPGLTPTISNYGAPDSKMNEHPLDYVAKHKKELESWNTAAWKDLLERLQWLRDAWEARKAYLKQLPYRWPGVVVDVPTLTKECEANINQIAASRYQLAEAQAGYRHSTDPASKSRVREALNAGLNNLPDWPTRDDELRTGIMNNIAQTGNSIGANWGPMPVQQVQPSYAWQQQQQMGMGMGQQMAWPPTGGANMGMGGGRGW